MGKRFIRQIASTLALAMFASVLLSEGDMQAAPKPMLSAKKVTLKEKKSKVIRVKKVKNGSFRWNLKNKKVASLKKKGKYAVTIRAKKAGTTTLTCRIKQKGKTTILKCKIQVKKSKSAGATTETTSKPNVVPSATPSTAPSTTTAPADATPTVAPMSTPTPTPPATATPVVTETPFDYSTPEDYKQSLSGVTYGTKDDVYYDSTTTGVERHAYIVLPPNYTEEKEYPVVYLLHGIGGSQNEWFGGKPIEILGNLMANGEAEEMIMVFPNVRARKNDSACYELTVEHFQAFDNFINDLRDDLMPYINAHYSVAKGRENTAICGLSMGGRESLYIGLSMPETFGYIGAFEPAIGVLPYNLEDGLFTEDTLTLPDEYKNNTFLMIVKGENDGTVGENPLLYHNALLKNGNPHLYYEMPGGHDFSVWSNGLYHFLKHLF